MNIKPQLAMETNYTDSKLLYLSNSCHISMNIIDFPHNLSKITKL